jgi:hypothetical protein
VRGVFDAWEPYGTGIADGSGRADSHGTRVRSQTDTGGCDVLLPK